MRLSVFVPKLRLEPNSDIDVLNSLVPGVDAAESYNLCDPKRLIRFEVEGMSTLYHVLHEFPGFRSGQARRLYLSDPISRFRVAPGIPLLRRRLGVADHRKFACDLFRERAIDSKRTRKILRSPVTFESCVFQKKQQNTR